uniref:Uncharacterized protein n=1 Tax=Oryza nivara TaxID=4536 RepID=A0A0E0I317_ORYNI
MAAARRQSPAAVIVSPVAGCRRPRPLPPLPTEGSNPPTSSPAAYPNRRRVREEKGRGGERVMTWPADMWGSCGSHADSATT